MGRFNWTNNRAMRIYTGAALVVGLLFIFALREFITIYIFDFFVLAILYFAVTELVFAQELEKQDFKIYYIFVYIACAFLAFFIGCLMRPAFNYWMHFIAQFVVASVFLLYTFLMYYVDKPLAKQCRLKKVSVGSECRRIIRLYCSTIAYPIVPLFALLGINHFAGAAGEGVFIGLFSLLLVFVISSFTDTFAYFTGRALKGPKLCPKISPNKTIAGAVGGVFGALVGTLLLLLIFSADKNFSDFMTSKIGDATVVQIVFCVIAVFASIVSQAGDIYASCIKRKAGIKDFGKILPGHGGVMDRIDGILLNAVFIFIIMSYIIFV